MLIFFIEFLANSLCSKEWFKVACELVLLFPLDTLKQRNCSKNLLPTIPLCYLCTWRKGSQSHKSRCFSCCFLLLLANGFPFTLLSMMAMGREVWEKNSQHAIFCSNTKIRPNDGESLNIYLPSASIFFSSFLSSIFIGSRLPVWALSS